MTSMTSMSVIRRRIVRGDCGFFAGCFLRGGSYTGEVSLGGQPYGNFLRRGAAYGIRKDASRGLGSLLGAIHQTPAGAFLARIFELY